MDSSGSTRSDDCSGRPEWKRRGADVSPVGVATIKYFKHGKSSYTEVLEWAAAQKIDRKININRIYNRQLTKLQNIL